MNNGSSHCAGSAPAAAKPHGKPMPTMITAAITVQVMRVLRCVMTSISTRSRAHTNPIIANAHNCTTANGCIANMPSAISKFDEKYALGVSNVIVGSDWINPPEESKKNAETPPNTPNVVNSPRIEYATTRSVFDDHDNPHANKMPTRPYVSMMSP